MKLSPANKEEPVKTGPICLLLPVFWVFYPTKITLGLNRKFHEKLRTFPHKTQIYFLKVWLIYLKGYNSHFVVYDFFVYFHQNVNCRFGMDQRKVNVVEIESCDDIKRKNKPIILSHRKGKFVNLLLIFPF